MEIANIELGLNVNIDPSSSINNVSIGDRVKISKYCSVYGSKFTPLQIGAKSYVGMFSILNGYSARLVIGQEVSIAQNVNIMTDSGPNACFALQSVFPIMKGEVSIGDGSWIGTGTIIMPCVTLGRFCIVAANSFVNRSFGDFCVIGGSPAREIRKLSDEEIHKIQENLNSEVETNGNG